MEQLQNFIKDLRMEMEILRRGQGMQESHQNEKIKGKFYVNSQYDREKVESQVNLLRILKIYVMYIVACLYEQMVMIEGVISHQMMMRVGGGKICVSFLNLGMGRI